MGTICPEGPINWGPFVQGDRKGGTRSPGNKCVWDQISLSPMADRAKNCYQSTKETETVKTRLFLGNLGCF